MLTDRLQASTKTASPFSSAPENLTGQEARQETSTSHFIHSIVAMASQRMPLALHLPQSSLPPTSAAPSSSTPVQQATSKALASDFDLVCVPLTNDLWRERWERLCLRPVDDEEEAAEQGTRAWLEREKVMRDTETEAEKWRKEGGFRRTELNVTRLEETGRLVALASDWLELDAADEGIRFDSELVSRDNDFFLTCQSITKGDPICLGTPPRTPPLPPSLRPSPCAPTSQSREQGISAILRPSHRLPPRARRRSSSYPPFHPFARLRSSQCSSIRRLQLFRSSRTSSISS